MSDASPQELETIYAERFRSTHAYRQRVWRVLIREFFQKYCAPDSTVLDLGCGYGEFINQVGARKKYGMDLNPATRQHLSADVEFLQQDCSAKWSLPAASLDLVFTSNFFEHLPDKATLGRTLHEAIQALKPGGRLVAMGPNIRYLPGQYWDFWDHYLPLTEASLAEGLRTRGFNLELCYAQFLPYTMVNQREYPDFFLKCYLKCPLAWRFLGKQFLVVASKPQAGSV